jgi:hypothetical protein
MGMRYWAYFAAKLIVAGGILYGSLGLLNPLAPPIPEPSAAEPGQSAKDLAAAPKSHPDNPRIIAAPDAQILTELPEPSAQQKEDAGSAKLLDIDGKKQAPAPINFYGREYLAINLALMVWFLFGAGMLYLIVYDQRYRCRVCLRRLRMPVETGSRGFMLQLGRPRTEYICPYGHGTLKQEEFQTSGLENPEWTAHSGDMWDELYAASKQDRDEQ